MLLEILKAILNNWIELIIVQYVLTVLDIWLQNTVYIYHQHEDHKGVTEAILHDETVWIFENPVHLFFSFEVLF